MKYAFALSAASLAAASPLLVERAGTCQAVSNVLNTFYGYPDNSPPGAGTAYDCGKGSIAGGVGTFDDPLTFATAPGEFNQCEVIYIAYLKKYGVFQDTCAQCQSDWSSGQHHIDIWTGSSTSAGTNQIQCEDDLTPNAQMVLRNPPSNLDVDSTPLYSNGQCQTSHTYNNNQASCSGGSGGSGSGSSSVSSSTGAAATSSATGSASAPAPTSTGSGSSGSGSGSSGSCAWEGHCAGATCSNDNDCSGSMTCNSGTCGN